MQMRDGISCNESASRSVHKDSRDVQVGWCVPLGVLDSLDTLSPASS